MTGWDTQETFLILGFMFLGGYLIARLSSKTIAITDKR
jgi:hypothetical protein